MVYCHVLDTSASVGLCLLVSLKPVPHAYTAGWYIFPVWKN